MTLVIDSSIPKSASTPRRPASTSSLQSLSSQLTQGGGAQFLCPHRCHRQLDKLRSLKLTHNKLSRLALTTGLDAGKTGADEDSTEEAKLARSVSTWGNVHRIYCY